MRGQKTFTRTSPPANDAVPGVRVLDALTGGQALVSLVAYLVLAPALIGWLVTRRDVA